LDPIGVLLDSRETKPRMPAQPLRTSRVVEALRDKLADIPPTLLHGGFNALSEILELLDMDGSPSGQIGTNAINSASPPVARAVGATSVAQRPTSIETRLEYLCSYLGEDWGSVIDDHFSGFDYCIRSFSRYLRAPTEKSLPLKLSCRAVLSSPRQVAL
jgi:hypothetical protein